MHVLLALTVANLDVGQLAARYWPTPAGFSEGAVARLLQGPAKASVVDLGRVIRPAEMMHAELWLQLIEFLENEQIITSSAAGRLCLTRGSDESGYGRSVSRCLNLCLRSSKLALIGLEGDGAGIRRFCRPLVGSRRNVSGCCRGSVKSWAGPRCRGCRFDYAMD